MVCNVFFSILNWLGCTEMVDPIYYDNRELKTEYSDFEQDLIIKINQHRNGIYLQECLVDDWLSALALEHNIEMISTGKVNHNNFNQRIHDINSKYETLSIGENVSYGYTTPDSTVSAWKKSDKHKYLLEKPNFNLMGLAATKNEKGRIYVTNIFISIKN